MINKPFLTLIGTTGLAALCSFGVALAGDKDKEDETDARIGEKVDKICFARSIDSFSNNERRSVVLRKSVNEEYYVETASCLPLRDAMRISVDSTGGCLRRGDYLIVSDSMFANNDRPFGTDRCLVRAIYKWNPDAEEAEDAGEETETAETEPSEAY